MGTISSAHDRPLRTAAVIATEDEAIAVTNTIANIFGSSAAGRETAEARLELLSRSGLFGISVPTDHGGIDVSNTVLASICSDASARSTTLGEILSAHFVGVERLRSYGTEGQCNTVFAAARAGARLALAAARANGAETDALPLLASGLVSRLTGEALCSPCTRHADWVLVPTQSAGKVADVLLPVRIEGLRYVANTCEPPKDGPQPAEHVLFKDVIVEGDVLLHAIGDAARRAVPHALELLLGAARELGAGRRALWRLMDADHARPLAIGLAAARLASVDAMIAEAGRAIDAAQIGLADQHRTNAFLAAASALAVAQEALRSVKDAAGGIADPETGRLSPQALVALEESGRINLDAHRRGPDGDD